MSGITKIKLMVSLKAATSFTQETKNLRNVHFLMRLRMALAGMS